MNSTFSLFLSELRHFNISLHKLCIFNFLEKSLCLDKFETQTQPIGEKMTNKWNSRVVEENKVVLNAYRLKVTLEYLCNTNRKCIKCRTQPLVFSKCITLVDLPSEMGGLYKYKFHNKFLVIIRINYLILKGIFSYTRQCEGRWNMTAV